MTRLIDAIKTGDNSLALKIINTQDTQAYKEWCKYCDEYWSIRTYAARLKFITSGSPSFVGSWTMGRDFGPAPYLTYQIYFNSGWDAISLALSKGMLDVFDAIQAGKVVYYPNQCEIEQKYLRTEIPLNYYYVAIGTNNLELVQRFFFANNYSEVEDKSLWSYSQGPNHTYFTPLQFALAANCELKIIQYLLENGAQTHGSFCAEALHRDSTTDIEVTLGGRKIQLFHCKISFAGALFIAVHYLSEDNPEAIDIINLLLQYGANIQQQTVYNNVTYTPATYAHSLCKEQFAKTIKGTNTCVTGARFVNKF